MDDVRCPTCSHLLVLRSGPAIRAHFAHRPRQSCRKRPGGGPRIPLRLEQLTLFELEPLPAETIPVFYWAPRAADPPPPPVHPAAQRRRRRRAWLPRLLRWLKARVVAG
ncbi:MAG: competence protein CoiA [Actinobacteria bacterium]|nr:competence protein CoiA [Actinomycetota bacterium]